MSNRCLLLLIVLFVLVGCATDSAERAWSPAHDVGEEQVEAETERLQQHLPANTQVMVRLQPDEGAAVAAQLKDWLLDDPMDIPAGEPYTAPSLFGVENALETVVDGVPEEVEDAVDLAVGPAVPALFWDYLEWGVPIGSDELLPRGWHMRMIIPADDAQALAADMKQGCDEGELAALVCHQMIQKKAADGVVLVDLLTDFDGSAQQGRKRIDLLTERDYEVMLADSPAMRRYLFGDDAVAVYATVDRLRRYAAFAEAGELRSDIDRGIFSAFVRLPEQMSEWQEQMEPTSEDVYDLVLAAALHGDDEPDLIVDAVQTYTEEGRANHPVSERSVYEMELPAFEEPIVQAAWNFSAREFDVPERLSEHSDRLRSIPEPLDWFSDLEEIRFDVLLPWLESPDTLAQQFWFAAADGFIDGFDWIDQAAQIQLPNSDEFAHLDQFAFFVGIHPDAEGEPVPEDYKFGFVFLWEEAIWEHPEETADLLEEALEQIDSQQWSVELQQFDDGAQRLVVGINADEVPLSKPQPELVASPDGFVDVDYKRIPDHFEGEFGWFTPPGDQSRLRYAVHNTETQRIRRVGFDEGADKAFQPVAGGEEETFSGSEAQQYPDCIGQVRREVMAELDELQRMTPENRRRVVQRATEEATGVYGDCIDEYPEAEELLRRAKAGWKSWAGHLLAQSFDYMRATPYLDDACKLGDSVSCHSLQRVEQTDGFYLPPPLRPLLHTRMRTAPLLVSDEGVFKAGERLVDGDELRDNPGEAAQTAWGTREVSEEQEDEPDSDDELHLVPDALAEAALFGGLVAGFDQPVSVVTDANGLDTSRFRIEPHEAFDEPLQVRITHRGYEVTLAGEPVAPVDGCDDDGPTLCLDESDAGAREIVEELRENREDRSADEYRSEIAQLDALYPAHQLYEMAVEAYDALGVDGVEFSAESGVPVQVLVATADALRYRKQDESFETRNQFDDAMFETAFTPEGDEKYRELLPQIRFEDGE